MTSDRPVCVPERHQPIADADGREVPTDRASCSNDDRQPDRDVEHGPDRRDRAEEEVGLGVVELLAAQHEEDDVGEREDGGERPTATVESLVVLSVMRPPGAMVTRSKVRAKGACLPGGAGAGIPRDLRPGGRPNVRQAAGPGGLPPPARGSRPVAAKRCEPQANEGTRRTVRARCRSRSRRRRTARRRGTLPSPRRSRYRAANSSRTRRPPIAAPGPSRSLRCRRAALRP